MKRLLPACLAALLLHPLFAYAQASNSDEMAIREAMAVYTNATNSGNVNAWSKTLTDNVVFLPPDHVQLEGKTAVVAWAKATFFDRYKMQLEMAVDEVHVQGTWAFARGRFKLVSVPKAGGAEVRSAGKFLSIFHRESDGRWRYARSAHNFDQAPGPAR